MKNYMEDIVFDVFKEFKRKNPDFCSCKQCEDDVIALALNRLKGKYAVNSEGHIFGGVMLNDRQLRIDALLAIIDVARIVSKNPNH